MNEQNATRPGTPNNLRSHPLMVRSRRIADPQWPGFIAGIAPALVLLVAFAPALGAAADPKSTSDSSAEAIARQGTDYFDAKDYESARQAFARAYELGPTPEALLNLALAEINSQHVVQGIQHLRTYLRIPGVAPSQASAVRQAVLLKAYAKVARLSVNVPEGTTVRLDDRSEIVRTGDDEFLVVAPGSHKLRTNDGRTAEFTAEAGGAVNLNLPQPNTGALPLASGSAALAPKPASSAADRAPEPAAAPSRSESSPRFWDTRTVVLTIGAGITLAALGTGGYFLAKEASDQDKVDARRQELRTKYGTPNSCLEGRVGAQDPWCSDLKALADTKVLAQNIATASLITAGVAGLGTLAGLLFWPKGEHRTHAGFVVTPVAARDTVGITLGTAY